MRKQGGKEAASNAGSLFPRLHVKDAAADRGGPRAPPRNKMALYEQLTTPSPRFNPVLPLPSYSAAAGAASSLASASSSQGGNHERSLFSPFCIHQSPAQSVDMLQSRTYSANNFRSTGSELSRKPVGHAKQKSSTSAASVVQVRPFLPQKFSSGKSCEEELDDEDDFRVPSFLHSDTIHSNKDVYVIEAKRSTPLHENIPQKNYSCTLNSSTRFPSSYDKPLEETGADPKSRKHDGDQNEDRYKETVVMKQRKEKSVSHLEAGEELAVNSSKSFDQEQASTRNFIEKPCQGNIRASLGSCANSVINEPGFWSARNDAENRDSLLLRNELYSKDSLGTTHRSPNQPDNCNHGSDDQVSGSVELKGADKNDEVYETSVAESISGMEISPDDVVGEIGQKQFWKARQAIVNQQRVFSVQVFELHRLIKVQKLIAASPSLLLEENPNRSESPQKVTNKNLPPEAIVEPQQQTAKQKNELQKLREESRECQTDNTVTPPLPSRDDDPNNGLRQLPKYGEVPPLPVAPEHRQTSWCYPPGNHWLVPVMSPSEGLIYKPYTGPFPPAAGFMIPAYGNCGPLSLPPVAGHSMNATYGTPPSHQQQTMTVLSGTPEIAPNYFPNPYGHSLANPNISAMASKSPIPRSEAFSGCPPKDHTSKESELQGSTTSSPSVWSQKEGRDALPHIPTAPRMNGSSAPLQPHGGHRHTSVIKVVPHKAGSASESVARIFQTIQEERQQYES